MSGIYLEKAEVIKDEIGATYSQEPSTSDQEITESDILFKPGSSNTVEYKDSWTDYICIHVDSVLLHSIVI